MYEIRRKEREKDAAFALELLKECEYAILATVNADGSPYCTAISPVLDGNTVYFHCALEGNKIDNLQREPRVCLTCVGKTELLPEKLTTRYESAIAFGTAEMIEDEAEKIAALHLFCQKYMPLHPDAAEQGIRQFLTRTGICKIQITRITGKARA